MAALAQRRRAGEDIDGIAQPLKSFRAAANQALGAQGDAKRAAPKRRASSTSVVLSSTARALSPSSCSA